MVTPEDVPAGYLPESMRKANAQGYADGLAGGHWRPRKGAPPDCQCDDCRAYAIGFDAGTEALEATQKG